MPPEEESLLHGSLWMISGQGVAMVAQIVYFILIGRALGSREYGAFVGVAALIASLSQFSSLGMEMILVRNVSRDRASFPPTWGHALLFTSLGFLGLLALAMLIAHFVLRPELRPLVPWIALADGLLGKLVQLAARAFQGAGRLAWTARLTALTYIGRVIAAAGLSTFARAHHMQSTALLWAHLYWIATLAVALFALTLATLRLGRPRFVPPCRADLSEGLSFSLSSSSISVYNDIDKTFLVSLDQMHAAGIYSAAYRVVDAASAPIYAVYAAAAPRFFRHGAAGARSARDFARITLRRTLPLALAATVLLAIAAPLLPVLFGPSFRDSVHALRWLCLLPVLRALHYSWGSAITGSASQWNRTATQFGAAALNLCLNWLLIPRWSWQGAALASLLTDAALAAASYWVLARLTRREAPAIMELAAGSNHP
ncbi:MAG TPA: oligosaccharide flippase family protein [Acidobacteriaceae bacterium]|jgi:O-antigen/teichoic acid export membrane protein|nr:oligosaccharide flippase family protein [Acidobacteriaceae bacterium]